DGRASLVNGRDDVVQDQLVSTSPPAVRRQPSGPASSSSNSPLPDDDQRSRGGTARGGRARGGRSGYRVRAGECCTQGGYHGTHTPVTVLHTPPLQFEQFNEHGQPRGIPPGTGPLHPGGMDGQVVVVVLDDVGLVVVLVVVVVDVVVVVVVLVVVVVDVVVVVGTVVVEVVLVVVVVGHGVVRGRHLRTNPSRSLRGLVPFAAVAFALNRTMRFCVTGTATKLPQAEPSSELGTPPAGSLGLKKSFWSPVGGWQAARFGSVWLMQTATLNVQEPLPHSPSVSQGSPSVQETTRPPRTSGPGKSMPWTFNST